MGTLAAPALVGVVLAFGSEATVFALAAVSCLLGAVLVTPLRSVIPAAAPSEPDDEGETRFGGSLSFVRRDPQAAMLVVLLGAQGVAIGALGVLSVEFALGVLHRGVLAPLLVWLGGISLALICVGVILPLVAFTAGRRLLDIDRHATVPVVEVALLRSMPLFAPLAPPTLESLARAVEPRSMPAGVEVIREGDVGDRFYVIADGEVQIVRDGQVVATRRRGEGFGEIALMYDVPRTATVITRRETRLYSLEREAFLLAVTGHAAAQRAHDLAEARLEELRVMDDAAVPR